MSEFKASQTKRKTVDELFPDPFVERHLGWIGSMSAILLTDDDIAPLLGEEGFASPEAKGVMAQLDQAAATTSGIILSQVMGIVPGKVTPEEFPEKRKRILKNIEESRARYSTGLARHHRIGTRGQPRDGFKASPGSKS